MNNISSSRISIEKKKNEELREKLSKASFFGLYALMNLGTFGIVQKANSYREEENLETSTKTPLEPVAGVTWGAQSLHCFLSSEKLSRRIICDLPK